MFPLFSFCSVFGDVAAARSGVPGERPPIWAAALPTDFYSPN
jgi:hypothetical protein